MHPCLNIDWLCTQSVINLVKNLPLRDELQISDTLLDGATGQQKQKQTSSKGAWAHLQHFMPSCSSLLAFWMYCVKPKELTIIPVLKCCLTVSEEALWSGIYKKYCKHFIQNVNCYHLESLDNWKRKEKTCSSKNLKSTPQRSKFMMPASSWHLKI